MLEQEIVWNGFPGMLRRRWGRDRALLVDAHVLPLSLRMDAPAPYFDGGVWDRLSYRPQDEYCEWRLTRDEHGRITRVTFTRDGGDRVWATDTAAGGSSPARSCRASAPRA